MASVALFDRHRCAGGGDISSRHRCRLFCSCAGKFANGICIRRDRENTAHRVCVRIDPVARRDVGQHRVKAAGELDAEVDDGMGLAAIVFIAM